MISPEYSYWATVLRWVDGDTLDMRVDLGFRLFTETRFRVHGLDTPERTEPGWSEATAYGNNFAPPGFKVATRTHKSDSFGRWLAEVELPDGRSYSAEIISAGLGVVYK